MGSLAADIEAARHSKKKGPACSVALLLPLLDDEDREALIGYLRRPEVPATIISAELDKLGHRIGADTLRRHRNRLLGTGADKCACPV